MKAQKLHCCWCRPLDGTEESTNLNSYSETKRNEEKTISIMLSRSRPPRLSSSSTIWQPENFNNGRIEEDCRECFPHIDRNKSERYCRNPPQTYFSNRMPATED